MRLRIAVAAVVILLICGTVIVLWGKARRTKFPTKTATLDASTSVPVVTRPTGKRLEDRFGRQNVVMLNLTNIRGGREIKERIEARMPLLVPSAQRAWEYPAAGTYRRVKVAPVENLDELAKRIDFGTVTSIDRRQRIVNVKVDSAKFTAAPSLPSPR